MKIFLIFLSLFSVIFTGNPAFCQEYPSPSCKEVKSYDEKNRAEMKVEILKYIAVTNDDLLKKHISSYLSHLSKDDWSEIADATIESCSWRDEGSIWDRNSEIIYFLLGTRWHDPTEIDNRVLKPLVPGN